MNVYVLDCTNIYSEVDFWNLYLETVKPEGAGYFGRNLHAFWDALSAGGPGWPGECQIELIKVKNMKTINDGKFYLTLQSMAQKLEQQTPVAAVTLKFSAE